MTKLHLADRWRELPVSPYNAVTRVDGTTVRCDPPRTKVCIYGAGRYKNEAPLEDPEWCVWALNLCAPVDRLLRFRADVWWDIHQRKAQTADDLRWIHDCPFPIYVPPDLEDGSPRSVRYPLAEVEAVVGASYWACTFAYQIALVMYENYVARKAGEPKRWTDLGLYGVELAYGTEREQTFEWACVSYWLGRAEATGLTIWLPEQTTLATHPARYGFEYDEEINRVHAFLNNHGRRRHATEEYELEDLGPDLRAEIVAIKNGVDG